MAQITIEGVSHIYRPPRGRPVLDGVWLDVRAREFLALRAKRKEFVAQAAK